MKTAAKVFIWIGMIVGCILIFPVIVGVFSLKKIDEAESSKDLQTMGILTLFFCNMLGGIFMLCIKDNELDNNNNKEKIIQTNNYSNQNEILSDIEVHRKNILITTLSLILLYIAILFFMIMMGVSIRNVLIFSIIFIFIIVIVVLLINKKTRITTVDRQENNMTKLEKELEKLKELFDKKFISEEEYQKMREKVINKYSE